VTPLLDYIRYQEPAYRVGTRYPPNAELPWRAPTRDAGLDGGSSLMVASTWCADVKSHGEQPRDAPRRNGVTVKRLIR